MTSSALPDSVSVYVRNMRAGSGWAIISRRLDREEPCVNGFQFVFWV